MNMKICKECKEEKPFEAFYRDKRTIDGCYSRCKACHNKAADAKKMERYYSDPDFKAKRIEASRVWQKEAYGKRGKFMARQRARVEVRHAIRRGELVKGPCEECGEKAVQAHHPDYTQPLNIMWLCHECHKLWHKNNMAIYPSFDKE